MEGPLIMLICAITFLVFVISVSIVGVLMYRLGINGRITRMMEDADSAKSEKKEKEPAVIPGAEYDPLVYGQEPRKHWSYDQDDLSDDEEIEDERFVTDEEIEESEVEDEPFVPNKNKHKVVMTGGGLYGGNSADQG